MGIAEDTAIAIREESVPRVESSYLSSLSYRVSSPPYKHRTEMSSGVTVHDECLAVFQELKLRKKHKYIIFRLNDAKTEIIKYKESTSQEYEDFLTDLPENECRWAVYDLEYQKEEGGLRNKIIFFHWSPDGAKIKDKMVAASSREAIRRALVGIAVEIQGTDSSEVAYETVLEKAKRGN